MEHIGTHKIHPVYLRPGDRITLQYGYEEPEGTFNTRILNVDDVSEPMMVDTVLVYRLEGEFGLKAGRALLMGEDDGTYKNIPPSNVKIPRY
jgi:hypothetical protein